MGTHRNFGNSHLLPFPYPLQEGMGSGTGNAGQEWHSTSVLIKWRWKLPYGECGWYEWEIWRLGWEGPTPKGHCDEREIPAPGPFLCFIYFHWSYTHDVMMARSGQAGVVNNMYNPVCTEPGKVHVQYYEKQPESIEKESSDSFALLSTATF